MKDYTRSSHIKNYYENGRPEPRILLESYTEDGEYIEYSSKFLSSAIVQYNGYIPDAENIDILVWHSSESVEDPINYVIDEYDSIDTLLNTVDEQVSLEDRVEQELEKEVTPNNYEDQKAKFLKQTGDERNSYCTTLITCTCGSREVYTSVSEAIAEEHMNHNKNEEEHDPNIWYYCGHINNEIRKDAMSIFEGARAKNTSLIDKIRGKATEKDPIDAVPIHYTPLSVALQEVDCYKLTEHSSEDPPKP